ncbi:MAG TPA: aminoacyl-tRNA hydrolase [Terriglobales bacterium]|jgi:PTH1 family peptidyl-tRNA hydrolase|nr:aminoacyl-tRNA hydrolase [Terriglobales bacterium]
MKLIVGLGNPGIEYQFTPHNMGFLAIDRIAEKHGVRVINRHCHSLTAKVKVGEVEALLAKPETFMNLSGMAVRELVGKYEADPAKDLVVLYDELDFPLGTLRIRERGSSAGHNGLESIMGALNTQEFVRVRLGIGPEHKVRDGAGYVLSQFKKAQYETIDLVLDRAADAVEVILKEGVGRAMNRFNQREKDDEV